MLLVKVVAVTFGVLIGVAAARVGFSILEGIGVIDGEWDE